VEIRSRFSQICVVAPAEGLREHLVFERLELLLERIDDREH
jgi:hypothetical protein